MAALSFDPGAFLGGNAGEALDTWEIQEEEQRWGIWLNGMQCFKMAHFVSLNDEKRYQIATSPIEDGGFINTDKVDTPYTGTLQLVCDGTDRGSIAGNLMPELLGESSLMNGAVNTIKRAFFDELKQRCGDLQSYVARTPEGETSRINLVGWSRSKQTHQWANMVVVNLYVQEVRSATTSGWVKGVDAPQQVKQENGQVVVWKAGKGTFRKA